MKPFQLVVDRSPWLVPRYVEDAFGIKALVRVNDADVPRHLLLQMHGFPSDAASIEVVYPQRLSAEEKIFPLVSGHVAIDGAQGYLRRVLAMSPQANQTHYEVLANLIATYRAYARNLPVHNEWRWFAIFVAEFMSVYWSDNARDLKILARVPPAL